MGIRITPKIHPSFSRWPSHPNILPLVLSSTSFSPQDFWSPFVPSSNYTAHPPHFHLHQISLLPFLHLLYERGRKIISNSSIQDDGSTTLVFHFLVYSLSQASVGRSIPCHHHHSPPPLLDGSSLFHLHRLADTEPEPSFQGRRILFPLP